MVNGTENTFHDESINNFTLGRENVSPWKAGLMRLFLCVPWVPRRQPRS